MNGFSVGEEVLFDDEVYVVSARSGDAPRRYRLLASRPDGTRFVWATEEELHPMDRYLRSRDDTTGY